MGNIIHFIVAGAIVAGVVVGANEDVPKSKPNSDVVAHIQVPPLSAPQQNHCHARVAEVLAKDIVRNRLRDPGSAKFEHIGSFVEFKDGECHVMTQGVVRAKNGFGGYGTSIFEIRQRSVDQFEYTLDSVEIQ